MNKTFKIQILAFIFTAVLAMALSVNNAKAQSGPNHLTGCIDRFARIVKIAFGDSPSRNCIELEQQITFKIDDPLGATETIPFYISHNGVKSADDSCYLRCDSLKQVGRRLSSKNIEQLVVS